MREIARKRESRYSLRLRNYGADTSHVQEIDEFLYNSIMRHVIGSYVAVARSYEFGRLRRLQSLSGAKPSRATVVPSPDIRLATPQASPKNHRIQEECATDIKLVLEAARKAVNLTSAMGSRGTYGNTPWRSVARITHPLSGPPLKSSDRGRGPGAWTLLA